VYRCTCAASESFSNGSRGTPGCENTLNRVPELPNAQLGTSIENSSSPRRTASAAPVALELIPVVIVVIVVLLCDTS
jgi:hypothetical protein